MGWKLSDLVVFPLTARRNNNVSRLNKGDSPETSENSPDSRVSSIPTEKETIHLWEKLSKGAEDRSSSGPLPCVSDPKLTLEQLLKKGAYKLKIKKGIRKKDLFRFLLAKMLYEKEEGLHLDEFLVLWELYLQLQETLAKDPSFREKYGVFFENTFYFFRELGNQREFPIRIEDCENSRYLERLSEILFPMLPTRSAYFGLKGQKSLKSGFSLVFESELLNRKLAPGRRIGVGYRDKGSRRDPALDGSPDWREVACSKQEERIREVEEYLKVVRESPDFDWDLVYNLQALKVEIDEEVEPPPQFEEPPLPEDVD